MDFSLATLSIFDISLFGFGVVAAITGFLVKKRGDERHDALLAKHNALIEKHDVLMEEYNALREEFRAFQSNADRRNHELRQEFAVMQAEAAQH